ncbi:MAG: hypothetical protein Q9N34_06650 [Aquificota bacterium]|nr:hypothetical protein [Aquificota bacterium]
MDWLIESYLEELRKIRDPKTVETKEHLLKHLTVLHQRPYGL